ncbi:MAG: PHP domain-containing protein [Oligosphaeraceae bacterium]|nr:PHP domain-containing protein [Oligosphaeraceae bacterium]
MIDLHCHSTASDGSCTPTELILMAKQSGLKALALTDHDNTNGLPEFELTAKKENFEAILGIELACKVPDQLRCHIVGLFIDRQCRQLQEMLTQIVQWRNQRNVQILERLAEVGKPLSLEFVKSFCPGKVLGRPHIAEALVARGHCQSRKEAFEQLIGRGCPAYVPRQAPAPQQCIEGIQAAGGLAIWAHPFSNSGLNTRNCKKIAMQLKEAGLDGIEAYYSMHKPSQTKAALKIAAELGLLVSGGSDFHGRQFPTLKLGVGCGKLKVPAEILPPLRQKALERRQALSI